MILLPYLFWGAIAIFDATAAIIATVDPAVIVLGKW